jgi:hypothetical protein
MHHQLAFADERRFRGCGPDIPQPAQPDQCGKPSDPLMMVAHFFQSLSNGLADRLAVDNKLHGICVRFKERPEVSSKTIINFFRQDTFITPLEVREWRFDV